jgi:hypothetical protein
MPEHPLIAQLEVSHDPVPKQEVNEGEDQE